jgi:hypothetical protein
MLWAVPMPSPKQRVLALFNFNPGPPSHPLLSIS